MPRPLVIIPTYNERDNLTPIVDRVLASVPSVEILVVDDSSPDGTGDVADRLASALSTVHVLHRTSKDGLGTAYLDGFAWGVERDFDVFVQLDADGSHLPEQLPRLLTATGEADVVLGSRWVPGGQVKHWSWHRRALSRGGSMYSRRTLGLPQRDVTSGFRVYTAEALQRMQLTSVHSHGYCFQIDMLLHAARAQLKIVEVPITFVDRASGTSKMSSRIVLEAMARVTRWSLTGMRARRALPAVLPAPSGPQG